MKAKQVTSKFQRRRKRNEVAVGVNRVRVPPRLSPVPRGQLHLQQGRPRVVRRIPKPQVWQGGGKAVTRYFHVPSAPSKPVREIDCYLFETLSRRRGCLVGSIHDKSLSFWKLRHYESEGCSIYLTQAQAEQIVALLQEENKQ